MQKDTGQSDRELLAGLGQRSLNIKAEARSWELGGELYYNVGTANGQIF